MAHNSRILLVDDNIIQSATRKAILESAGWEVTLAMEGRSALETLTGPEQNSFSLLITDHLMPVMSGPELVAEVRRLGTELPIIVLSGLPDAETDYEDRDVIFRLKPCGPESLILLVQELLGEQMRRTA